VSKAGGPSGTSAKEQGSHDLDIRLWGTKGLSKGPSCIGTERARTRLLFHSKHSYHIAFKDYTNHEVFYLIPSFTATPFNLSISCSVEKASSNKGITNIYIDTLPT
jgi:hypothetical protein